jgi:hypothetical protein
MNGLISNGLSVPSGMCLRSEAKRIRWHTIYQRCAMQQSYLFCPLYTLSLRHRKQGTLDKRCCYARGYFPYCRRYGCREYLYNPQHCH